MPSWLLTILTTAGTVLISATTTFLFNKFTGLPKVIKNQKEAEKRKEEQLKEENRNRDAKIASLEAAINALPAYRAQSMTIQEQLKESDKEILAACNAIKQGVANNQQVLNDRLDRLEKREKNAIRAKLLDEYRLFTDESKNPMLAWSEMEHHAFFELLRDYEELDGNDYVHSTVVPAMNELDVIPMTEKARLLELLHSRKL